MDIQDIWNNSLYNLLKNDKISDKRKKEKLSEFKEKLEAAKHTMFPLMYANILEAINSKKYSVVNTILNDKLPFVLSSGIQSASSSALPFGLVPIFQGHAVPSSLQQAEQTARNILQGARQASSLPSLIGTPAHKDAVQLADKISVKLFEYRSKNEKFSDKNGIKNEILDLYRQLKEKNIPNIYSTIGVRIRTETDIQLPNVTSGGGMKRVNTTKRRRR